jgi:hypothetical protein
MGKRGKGRNKEKTKDTRTTRYEDRYNNFPGNGARKHVGYFSGTRNKSTRAHIPL